MFRNYYSIQLPSTQNNAPKPVSCHAISKTNPTNSILNVYLFQAPTILSVSRKKSFNLYWILKTNCTHIISHKIEWRAQFPNKNINQCFTTPMSSINLFEGNTMHPSSPGHPTKSPIQTTVIQLTSLHETKIKLPPIQIETDKKKKHTHSRKSFMENVNLVNSCKWIGFMLNGSSMSIPARYDPKNSMEKVSPKAQLIKFTI